MKLDLNKHGESSTTIEGLTISIEHDPDPMNPREEFDNVGTMVCFHRRYRLGDEHHFSSPADAQAFLDDVVDQGGIYLPLYLYDHSGIAMRTTPLGDPWDSVQIGWIYATKGAIDHEWSGDQDSAESYLQGEVETYDQYLRGDVYGYTITDDKGELLDSCWGYYGDPGDYLISELEITVEGILDARAQESMEL